MVALRRFDGKCENLLNLAGVFAFLLFCFQTNAIASIKLSL